MINRRQFVTGSVAAGTALVTNLITGCQEQVPIEDVVNPDAGGGGSRPLSNPSATRRDAHRLGTNSEVMQAYSAAVAQMRQLPLNDCRSWDYQAAIHGTTRGQGTWPAGAPWNACQHRNLNFLPWHRLYLYFFERIVRNISGMPNFALPYWNYSRVGQANIPPAFRDPATALFDNTRNTALNSGSNLPASAIGADLALQRTNFSGSGQFSGALESTPHDTVHSLVGGNMGRFSTSGLDPLFWLHHSNIDRIWEIWVNRRGGSNPTQNAQWMAATSRFVDENCNLITMRNADVINLSGQLNIRYDDLSAASVTPVLPSPALAQMVPAITDEDEAMPDAIIVLEESDATISAEVVSDDLDAEIIMPSTEETEITSDELASDISLSGTNAASQIVVPVAPPPPVVAATSQATGEMRVCIEFDDIEMVAPFDGYFEIYLVNKGAEQNIGNGRYVGNLNVFGDDPESKETMRGKTMLMGRSIDITDQYLPSELGPGFSVDGLAVMLQPIVLGLAPSAELRKSAPRIGSMDIKTVILPIQ